jgi:phosphoserine aminotransferase
MIYNFSAGPAMLPAEVLKIAKDELLNFNQTGTSVMEMSHRSSDYMQVAEETQKNLRVLMNIPDNYKVLFLQGGATLQFASVPLNLCGTNKKADYIDTGIWSNKAIVEAQRFCDVNVAYSAKKNNFSTIEPQSCWNLRTDAAFVHYTPNETIGGLAFNDIPDTGSVPLVADMSSCILSQEFDVSRFGVIYAGAQKNIGPAGLTIVIVREDLIGHPTSSCPTLLNYATHAKNDSMSNTPPTFSWYMAGLVFKWLIKKGGVRQIQQTNKSKAQKLYKKIDESSFYFNSIESQNRSIMNVPFTLKDSKYDSEFLEQAKQNGLLNLKGHRSVGGMRASIYNAMPVAGIDKLISFMDEFANKKQ